MANTVKGGGGSIEITDIDSDWNWTEFISPQLSGLRVQSIQFSPGATDDQCIIRDAGENNGACFDALCADVYDQKIKYFDAQRELKPYLVYSEGTYSAGSRVIITLGSAR